MIYSSIFTGLRNYFFIRSDITSDSTYNYYGYQDAWGRNLIMRTTKDFTSADYFIHSSDFDIVFANRKTYNYVPPSCLIPEELKGKVDSL